MKSLAVVLCFLMGLSASTLSPDKGGFGQLTQDLRLPSF